MYKLTKSVPAKNIGILWPIASLLFSSQFSCYFKHKTRNDKHLRFKDSELSIRAANGPPGKNASAFVHPTNRQLETRQSYACGAV